jgi:hypothetical protein
MGLQGVSLDMYLNHLEGTIFAESKAAPRLKEVQTIMTHYARADPGGFKMDSGTYLDPDPEA